MVSLKDGMGFILSGICLSWLAAGPLHAADATAGLYVNSEGSPLIDLIDSAKQSLNFEIYEMDDPAVMAAVRRAIDRQVEVRVVKEPKPVGSPCKVFEEDLSPVADRSSSSCDDQKKLITQVRDAGGTYVPFNRQELCIDAVTKKSTSNCLEHGKIVIADSKTALISSGNFNSTNLCDLKAAPKNCNRDYSFLTTDSDVVQTLGAVFDKDVIGDSYDVGSLIDAKAAEKVTVGPLSLDPIVSFIQSANQSIQVENQYLKDPTINAALIKAAKSGVKIEITVASACSFGKPKPSEIKKVTAIYSAFDRAGISSRMFNKNILINGVAGYMHAKAIVVDGKRAWMGSVNGSTQAATRNREFGVFFEGPEDVKKLSMTLAADHADPDEETWKESLHCAENDRSAHH